MSASKNINAEKIQGNLNVNGLSATTVNVNGNYSLPNTAGTDGQVLSIDGGAVVWSSVTKTILNVSIGTNDQIPFMNSTPNDFDYSSELTFDSTKLRVSSSTNYVDIFDTGYIELSDGVRGMKIQPAATNVIETNSSSANLSIYSNNNTQLYLQYNNPNVGINNNAPAANLHVRPTTVGQTPFLVQNSVGDNLLEVTSDGKVKISDSYTLPTTSPAAGNVITADGAGGSSWTQYPLDSRWESTEGGTFSDGYQRGRLTDKNFRFVELNISASTNPNIFANNMRFQEACLTLGRDNSYGDNGGAYGVALLYHMLTIGTGNTIGQVRANMGLVLGDNNNLSVYSGWPTTISSQTNFVYNQVGFPNASSPSIGAHSSTRNFILGEGNYLSGDYNLVSGKDNLIFGESVNVFGSNVSGFTTDSGNNYNLRSTSVLGDNIHAFYSNQILIGRGFSTENTNNKTGIYFGWSSTGFTKPSMGFVENNDPNSDYYNFAMGGLDVFTSGETTGIFHEGAGSGNFFLYRDGSTVEPYDIIPSAVALFAKESPRGVTGLAVKSENNTYSMFTDTVSIGFTGGTAMLEVKSNGDSDSTDMLKVKNSNGDVGIQITDGLNVYMPNLPITPGGLSTGGLYIDTTTNTIKVV
jgi:hypothetical protein